MVKSISYSEQEIILNILALHCHGQSIELDPTYSKGNFYKHGLQPPKHKFDLIPQSPDVLYGDATDLPLPPDSIGVAMFDPPFLATSGPSLNTNHEKLSDEKPLYPLRMSGGIWDDEEDETYTFENNQLIEKSGNIINNRFTVYPDEKSLHEFYVKALKEFYRLLKPGGVLIFKCQDKVSSGKQYFMHCFVHDEAVKAGFYPKDLFILLARKRIVADWQKENQQHARKFHSYFWALIKK